MARNKYPEITVERILDAAQRLFLEKGYENTTIQDIVDELDGLKKQEKCSFRPIIPIITPFNWLKSRIMKPFTPMK